MDSSVVQLMSLEPAAVATLMEQFASQDAQSTRATFDDDVSTRVIFAPEATFLAMHYMFIPSGVSQRFSLASRRPTRPLAR